MFQLLKKIPFFSELSQEDLDKISSTVRMEYFPEGHVIFREGEAGEVMYILKRGTVQVLRDNTMIAELHDNDFFGEMALVSDAPRNATVKTVTDAEVLTLSKEDFKHLLENSPHLASLVSYEVIKRVNDRF